MKNSDVYIIVPVYNEAKVISGVIDNLAKHFSNIVCVNDGSKDSSAKIIAARKDVILVSHFTNLGQGAAIQTGLEFALQDKNAKYFVTFDSDGQHQIEDVMTMLNYIRGHKDVDIILGSRFLGTAQDISKSKKLLLKAATRFTNSSTGLNLTDAHNGLRVLSRKAAETIKITMPDMAHASEIIEQIASSKLNYKELPMTVTYTEYSKAKGQSAVNAINIAFDMMIQKVVKK